MKIHIRDVIYNVLCYTTNQNNDLKVYVPERLNASKADIHDIVIFQSKQYEINSIGFSLKNNIDCTYVVLK